MASLNVGVIGLGRMGSLYARNLAQRVTNARLVAVADQKADLREQLGNELAGVKVYASHQDLLQDKDVEAVVMRALQKDRAERFANASEFALALSSCTLAGTWTFGDATFVARRSSRPPPSGLMEALPEMKAPRVPTFEGLPDEEAAPIKLAIRSAS